MKFININIIIRILSRNAVMYSISMSIAAVLKQFRLNSFAGNGVTCEGAQSEQPSPFLFLENV